jgi:hypothetical protein
MLTFNIGQPNIWQSPPCTSAWGKVDAHAQDSQIYGHPTLILQLKVLHQHSVELILKLIELISTLFSAQPKWKVIQAVSGLLSVHFKSNFILNISN